MFHQRPCAGERKIQHHKCSERKVELHDMLLVMSNSITSRRRIMLVGYFNFKLLPCCKTNDSLLN